MTECAILFWYKPTTKCMGGFYKANTFKSIFNRTSIPACTPKSYQPLLEQDAVASVRYTTGANAECMDRIDYVHIWQLSINLPIYYLADLFKI